MKDEKDLKAKAAGKDLTFGLEALIANLRTFPESSPDANVEAIRAKLLERSKVGLKKYGVTTERDDLDLAAWLIHLQEELMDAAVYIEAAIRKVEGK